MSVLTRTGNWRVRSVGRLLLALLGSICWGQTTLSLASGSGAPGGTVALNLSLNSSSGQLAGLQWTFSYPSASISSVTVTGASALTDAGKTVSCAAGAGTFTCLVAGLNGNVIPNGVIASAQFTLSPSATDTNIGIINALGASASAGSMPVSATGGSISASSSGSPASVAALACSPSSLASSASAICTVTLSQVAPAGGSIVSLAGDNATLATPASVTVADGCRSAAFTAAAGSVASNQTANVTATLNGTTQSAALSLVAPVATLASLACAPNSLASNASATCTATLSQAAPTGGATVALSSGSTAITVPASLLVSGNSTSATFTATAAASAAAGTVVLTASLSGVSLTTSLAITAGQVTLSVGPGQTYAKPCQAFAAAGDGSLIQIDAGGTYQGDVCAITANNLIIRGINGRAKIDATGLNALGKAIWVIQGSNTTVENIELTGAGHPGAGIRQEGPGLTVRNCYFHHNDEGIITDSSTTGEILIEFSEFAYNGYGDGYTHNINIGNVPKFTLRYSYSHHASVGHLARSRAVENYILYNRLSSEATGTSNYELDLPNGGKSFIIGNLIERGPNASKNILLSYLEEGTASGIPSSDLFVVNNTFVNDGSTGVFINIGSASQTPAVIKNNTLYGPGTLTTQSTAILANNRTTAPLFADASNYDYRLTAGSPAIDAGVAADTAFGVSLTPDHEYVHPACGEERTTSGAAIDIGAYEFGGAGASLSCGPRGAALSSLALNPNTAAGGTTTTANTVTLSTVAPVGGALVALASSNPAAAAVPASVTVAAGSTSATFSIQTFAVTASTAVTVSASYSNNSLNATLTVAAPVVSLSSLQCGSTSLTSGSKTTCSVALSAAAPTGGSTVALSSNNAAIVVPASITVPAGSSTASFTATAATVVSGQTATLTAALNGTSRTVSLSVSPVLAVSSLSCSPATLASGASASCTVTLSVAAPAAGASVALSKGSAVLTAPSSVAFAAGASTTTFSVTAGTVSSAQTATISATLGGASKSFAFSLTPPPVSASLKGLSCTPQSVSAGGSGTCTVSLSGSAPAGGFVVALSSSSSSVTLSKSITVRAGYTSATFTFQTSKRFQWATITASAKGAKTAVIIYRR
jgi:hypothetical protein